MRFFTKKTQHLNYLKRVFYYNFYLRFKILNPNKTLKNTFKLNILINLNALITERVLTQINIRFF